MLVLVLLVYWAHGCSILDAVPSHPDDYRNWLVARNFHDVGFSSGYFVHNEIPARWTLTPFAADGPWFGMLFGALAMIGGWTFSSGVVFNQVLMSVALAVYALAARVEFRTVLWLALFIALVPLMIFMGLSTAYSYSYMAMGLVCALCFRLMFMKREQGQPPGPMLRILCFLTVLVSSIYKVDLALLFFPALMLGRRGTKSVLAWGGLALVMCLGSAAIMLYAGAPVGTQASTLGFWGASSPVMAAWKTVQHLVAHNVSAYLDGRLSPRELFAQALGLITLVYPLVPGLVSRSLTPALRNDILVFNACNIGAVFVLVNTMYIPYAGVGERYIVTHVLVTVFSQVGFFSRRMRMILLLCAAVMFLLGVRQIESTTLPYFDALPKARAGQFSRQAHAVLRYTPGADRWCNTVLNLNGEYPPEILGLPSGLGYSAVYDPERLKVPLKSRYVIHDGSDTNRDILEKGRFRPILKARFGTIYENLDSPCPRDAG